MAGSPAEADPSERPVTGERGQQSGPPAEGIEPALCGQPAQGERQGPVVIARHLKDDGRALLLYTRREDQPT